MPAGRVRATSSGVLLAPRMVHALRCYVAGVPRRRKAIWHKGKGGPRIGANARKD